MDLFYGFLIIV